MTYKRSIGEWITKVRSRNAHVESQLPLLILQLTAVDSRGDVLFRTKEKVKPKNKVEKSIFYVKYNRFAT